MTISLKRVRAVLLRLAGVLLLPLLPAEGSLSEQLAIRFLATAPEATPVSEGVRDLKLRIEARLKGQLTINILRGAVSPGESVDAVARGLADMALAPLTAIEKFSPKAGIFDQAFMFSDFNAVNRFQGSPAGRQILKD